MNDGDMLELTHTLASKVGVHGLFSDWPATTTFYANCMMKSLSPEGSSCDPLAPNSPPAACALGTTCKGVPAHPQRAQRSLFFASTGALDCKASLKYVSM